MPLVNSFILYLGITSDGSGVTHILDMLSSDQWHDDSMSGDWQSLYTTRAPPATIRSGCQCKVTKVGSWFGSYTATRKAWQRVLTWWQKCTWVTETTAQEGATGQYYYGMNQTQSCWYWESSPNSHDSKPYDHEWIHTLLKEYSKDYLGTMVLVPIGIEIWRVDHFVRSESFFRPIWSLKRTNHDQTLKDFPEWKDH